ncbi:unnamed protein product [Cochlearia groenlandica]
MGGMKDEAKRITIPPLFPRVHVNDTAKSSLSSPFNGKSISLYKPTTTTTLPSDHTNKDKACLSTDQSETKWLSTIDKTLRISKCEGKMKKRAMDCSSPKGSSVTNNTKSSSVKHNEYRLIKNFANLEPLKVPLVRRSGTDPQASTDFSLKFCNSSKALGGEEASGSKHVLRARELHLPESLEDAGHNGTLTSMKSQFSRGRTLDGINNETQKKLRTLPPSEQDVSELSAIDSLSGMSAFSNDIASVIGEKRFLKMRAYMIKQQKIFVAQVFELHRLIMVQKLVAKSPKFVIESKLNGGKKHVTARPEMAASRVIKPNTENQKPATEPYPEHMKPNLPIPSTSKDLVPPVWPQQLLPPPENQWLVPVMSHSEGLVYKPHTGPCPPPPSAFMVPIYGQDSVQKAYTFPVTHQFSHGYFPRPNTMTKLDQTNPFGQFQRWSSASSHVTQAIPFSLKKSQDSDDSDELGSTASSPPEKHKLGVLLPLFPTEPTHNTDEYKQIPQTQHRAIKAIPHKTTSASESAARIFKSIQEERRDSDYMMIS